MACSCSCSRRTKVLLVGATDMIVGGYGVIGFGLAMMISRDTSFMGSAWDPRYYRVSWDSGYWKFLRIFLPVLLMGTCTISAVTYKSNRCAIIATILRSVWALCWLSFTMAFYLGVLWNGGFYNSFWEASRTALMPGCYAIAQMYFIHVVLNYRKKELINLLDGEGGGEKSSSSPTIIPTEPEFAPLTLPQVGEHDRV